MVTIDVPHVFRIFRGPRGLLTALDRHQPKHGLTYSRVQMWQQRKQIPTKWIGAVLYCIENAGHSCREFLIDNDELVAPPPHRPGRKILPTIGFWAWTMLDLI